MKKVFVSLCMASVLMGLSSCASTKNAATLSSISGEWNIIEVNGTAVVPAPGQEFPYIGFDTKTGKVFGNSGCNRMMGTFEADSLTPGALSFGPIGSTRMACPDMQTEQMVLNALNKVKSYETVSDQPEIIALCSEDGKKMLTLQKKDESQVSLTDLSGEWAIELVNGKKIVGTTEVTPFIGFNTDENRIYGNVGCNTINGALLQNEKTANSLKFENIATTMMMCPDMETETTVLNALNETRSFSIKNGQVYLLGENGNELLVLKKQ